MMNSILFLVANVFQPLSTKINLLFNCANIWRIQLCVYFETASVGKETNLASASQVEVREMVRNQRWHISVYNRFISVGSNKITRVQYSSGTVGNYEIIKIYLFHNKGALIEKGKRHKLLKFQKISFIGQ